MTDDLTAITQELAEIQDALLALPEGDLAARHRLFERRDELRLRAAEYQTDILGTVPRAHLERELVALEWRYSEIRGMTINRIAQSVGGEGSRGFTDPAIGPMNRSIELGQGAGPLVARAAEIRKELERRDREDGDA